MVDALLLFRWLSLSPDVGLGPRFRSLSTLRSRRTLTWEVIKQNERYKSKFLSSRLASVVEY